MQFNIKKIKRDITKIDIPILLVLICSLIIRILLIRHCLWVDEARDLSITYNLIHKGTLTTFGGVWWFQHPIMQYIILTPSVILNSEYLATLTIVLSALITIYAVYIIGRTLFNTKVGLLSAFVFGSLPIYIFISTRILNDVTHTMFVTLSFMYLILFYKKKIHYYSGLSILFSIFAATTRITSGLLPFLILSSIIYIDKKNILKNKWVYLGVIVGLIPGLIWIGLNYVHTGRLFDFSIWEYHLKPGILDSEPWYYYLKNFTTIYTIALTIMFIIGLLMNIISKLNRIQILIIWFIFYFIIISLVSVKVPRYVLPTYAPFVVIGVSGMYLISRIKGIPKETESVIILLIIVLGLWLSYRGYINTSFGAKGFCGLDVIARSIPKDKTAYAGSSPEISWYAKRNVLPLPRNLTSFENTVKPGDYIEVDLWERTQPKYIFNLIANKPEEFKLIKYWPESAKRGYVFLFEYIGNKSELQKFESNP